MLVDASKYAVCAEFSEQHDLLRGVLLEDTPPQAWFEDEPKAGNGMVGNVYVKLDPHKPDRHCSDFPWSSREIVYHNLACGFFFLAKYLPTVAKVKIGDLGYTVVKYLSDPHWLGNKLDGSPEDLRMMEKLYSSGELDKLAIMDYVMGNGDRHKHNYLISQGNFYLIDHDHAIPSERVTKGMSPPNYLSVTLEYLRTHPTQAKIHIEARKWASDLDLDCFVEYAVKNEMPLAYARHARGILEKIQKLLAEDANATHRRLYQVVRGAP